MLRAVLALLALLLAGEVQAATPPEARPLTTDECEAVVAALEAEFTDWAANSTIKIFDVTVPSDWIIDDDGWQPDTGVRPPAGPEMASLRPCTGVFAKSGLKKRLRLRAAKPSALRADSNAIWWESFWVSTPYFDQGGSRVSFVVGHRGDLFLAEAARQPDGRWLGRKTVEGYGSVE